MRAVALLLIAATGVGCSTTEEDLARPNPGLGKEKKVAFGYVGIGCAHGCALAPIMTGSDERLGMTPAQPAGTRVESSDPSILEATAGAPDSVTTADGRVVTFVNVDLKARSPGTAEVRIRNAAGELVDRTDIVVTRAARASLAVVVAGGGGTEYVEKTSVEVATGTSQSVTARAFGADGTELRASSGWTFTSSDPKVAKLDGSCAARNCATIRGVAVGSAMVSASGGGAGTSVSVVVK